MSSPICAHCCIVWCEQRKARPLLPELSECVYTFFSLSPLLLAPYLAIPPPTSAAPAKEATGTFSFFAAQRLPSTKAAEQPERRQRPEPKRTIPNLTFPPLPLLPIFSSSSQRFPPPSPSLSSSRALLSSIFLVVLPTPERPREPISSLSPAPGLKFLTLLIRFPTLSVACDDFRFATPCEQARLLLLRLLFEPNSVRLRLARNCDPQSLPAARTHRLTRSDSRAA
ncbi:hypothetical protein CSAL01_01678 [Colletotrichum salicis]|uniref:Uncharacterized protein n=1 Tax=Colletotrichum salicis TaxID=1209931 RepID=A0A135V5A1_9PEZI|nr:hypothetical protein CSAL01_01678 [Colletotrichum salicis]